MTSPNKCCESNSVFSLKGIVTDNDSGYISQNVESNSSCDASLEHRQFRAHNADIKEIFINENALLEHPSLPIKSDPPNTDYEEFDHLYFMSSISDNAIVPASVSSQSTTFSGFDTDDANVSGTIPIAPSIIIAGPSRQTPVKMKTFVLNPDKENDSNYDNIKNNSKIDCGESKLNCTFEDAEASQSSIQTRLMSANNDMSLFESFYSFVCNLYTKNEPVLEDTEVDSINPSQLHINKKNSECENNDSPSKNLYLELKSVKKVSELCISTPSKQKIPLATSTISPELFSDEEETEPVVQNNSLVQKSIEELICDAKTLVKRTRDSLGGVPPPPSITLPLVSATELLSKAIENKSLFTTQEDVDNIKRQTERRRCLLIDPNIIDLHTKEWSQMQKLRYHGIYYNKGEISEEFEHLCVRYAERYIGAETQSSCTAFGIMISSPTKRKFKYGRTTKSPGKNLSNLARRRITFSRDSLLSAGISANCASVGSRTRQIMVDAKKFDMVPRRRSPKKSPRKTPRKSPKKKSNTPKSSGKKKHAFALSAHAIEENLSQLSFLSSSRQSTTKRALFQSPPRRDCNSSLSWFNSDNSNSTCSQHSNRSSRRALFPSPKRNSPSKMTISSLYPARRKMTPKRVLFKSPDKPSIVLNDDCDKKRKRTEDEEQLSNKIAKITPSSAKDTSSEMKPSTSSQDITQHRKKKLMWTVAEALRTQHIDLKHPQFKVYASVLARIIRHFLPNLFTNGPRPEGSTTESMLRIARQYVFAVTRGKTVDQIIREAQKKSRIRRSTSCSDVDDVPNVLQVKNKENILQDRINVMEEISNNKPLNKITRSEKVERIRRVINFDDNDASNTSIR